jgi:hypothetical protein
MDASTERISARAIGTAAAECGSVMRQTAGAEASGGTAGLPFGRA